MPSAKPALNKGEKVIRKWRFTRPAASPFAVSAAALAIAVAVHALFLLPGYRTEEKDAEAKSPGIQMLNLSSFTPGQRKDFQHWLAIHDPAQAARSSSRSGYTAILKNNKKINVHVEPYRMAEIRTQINLTAFSPVPAGIVSVKDLPADFEQKSSVRSARKVLILDESGKKIPSDFDVIPERLGSSRPTVITVTDPGKTAQILVNNSCGVRELDLAAINKVVKMNLKNRTTLTFIWPGRIGK